MSIVDQFGRKKDNGKRAPILPPLPVETPVTPVPLSPAAQAAVASYGETFQHNMHLRAENEQLRNDLSVAHRQIKELQHQIDIANDKRDRLNRFCGTILANFGSIKTAVDATERASFDALDRASDEIVTKAADVLSPESFAAEQAKAVEANKEAGA